MTSGDEYVPVTAILNTVRVESIHIRHAKGAHWIPRSLIHGPDDSILNQTLCGSEIKFRMFEWKARQCGLLDTAEVGQGRLL